MRRSEVRFNFLCKLIGNYPQSLLHIASAVASYEKEDNCRGVALQRLVDGVMPPRIALSPNNSVGIYQFMNHLTFLRCIKCFKLAKN